MRSRSPASTARGRTNLLRLSPRPTPRHAGVDDLRPPRPRGVLFLGTWNSTRSQMAEGFLRSIAGGAWDVESAGFTPRPVDPLAIAVMRESGIRRFRDARP
ncbi:MAG: hypothetical protein U0166_28860 [Acidobacteriota bacterium]